MGTKRDKPTGRQDTLGREIKVSSQVATPAVTGISYSSYEHDNDMNPESLQSMYNARAHESAIEILCDKYGSIKESSDYLLDTLKTAGIFDEEYHHALQVSRMDIIHQRLSSRFNQSGYELSKNIYNPISFHSPVLTPTNDVMSTVASYSGEENTPARQFLMNYTEDFLNGFHHGFEPLVTVSHLQNSDNVLYVPKLGVKSVEDIVETFNKETETVEFNYDSNDQEICIETDFSEGLEPLFAPSSRDAQVFRKFKQSIEDTLISKRRNDMFDALTVR